LAQDARTSPFLSRHDSLAGLQTCSDTLRRTGPYRGSIKVVIFPPNQALHVRHCSKRGSPPSHVIFRMPLELKKRIYPLEGG
jgi:hypothetical protein